MDVLTRIEHDGGNTHDRSGSSAVPVHVRLFALARERAGRPSVALELPEGSTVADLKSALARALPGFAPLLPSLRIAVNAEYVSDDHIVPPGAEVAVIPPVSGGGVPSSTPSKSRRRR
jgi:molybdopterin converting factor subunit 1